MHSALLSTSSLRCDLFNNHLHKSARSKQPLLEGDWRNNHDYWCNLQLGDPSTTMSFPGQTVGWPTVLVFPEVEGVPECDTFVAETERVQATQASDHPVMDILWSSMFTLQETPAPLGWILSISSKIFIFYYKFYSIAILQLVYRSLTFP